MKNILNETPNLKLNPRLMYSTKFVRENDIKNKTILDIGCGYGWFELYVLKKGVKKIVGMEISELDLVAARKISDRRVSFKVGGALDLPFKANFFDSIVLWEVIEHIPKDSEDKMFMEISRVLKPKGSLYLSTPYDSFLSKYFDPAWWLVGHRHYSKNKLIDYGSRNGFKIKNIFVKGEFWNLISVLDMYISKWIFNRAPYFEEIINNKVFMEYKYKREGFYGIFVKYEKNN